MTEPHSLVDSLAEGLSEKIDATVRVHRCKADRFTYEGRGKASNTWSVVTKYMIVVHGDYTSFQSSWLSVDEAKRTLAFIGDFLSFELLRKT